MADVLLVYKKNFEGVHDESLQSVKDVLSAQSDHIRVDIRAREQVMRADFIGRDLVIVLGGDGTLTSISHNIDSNTPVMGLIPTPEVTILTVLSDFTWIAILILLQMI